MSVQIKAEPAVADLEKPAGPSFKFSDAASLASSPSPPLGTSAVADVGSSVSKQMARMEAIRSAPYGAASSETYDDDIRFHADLVNRKERMPAGYGDKYTLANTSPIRMRSSSDGPSHVYTRPETSPAVARERDVDDEFAPGKILMGDPRTEEPWTVGKVFCGFEGELPYDIPSGTEWVPWKVQGWYILQRQKVVLVPRSECDRIRHSWEATH